MMSRPNKVKMPSSGISNNENWNFPEIINYFRADREIAENITVQDFEDLFNYDAEWIKLVTRAIEYQTFDPKVTIGQLRKNRSSYIALKPKKMSWDLSNVGYNLSVTNGSHPENIYTNEESFARDMRFLITVFLSRNNHIHNIKKWQGGVSDILDMLKAKYNIVFNKPAHGSSFASTVITLPRIVGTFPSIPVRLFHDKVVKGILPYDLFPNCRKPATHAISCPLLPSVYPSTLIAGNFHPAMIWVAIKLDDINNSESKNFKPLKGILTNYRASFQSSVTPECTRLKIFEHIGLIGARPGMEGVGLTPDASALASYCLNDLFNVRTDDPLHSLMIKVARIGDFDMF